MIRELARQGAAILMISSELPEIIGMSDRIIVMWDGRYCGELPAGSSESEIMTLATGHRNGKKTGVSNVCQHYPWLMCSGAFGRVQIPPVYAILAVVFVTAIIIDAIFGRGQMLSQPF